MAATKVTPQGTCGFYSIAHFPDIYSKLGPNNLLEALDCEEIAHEWADSYDTKVRHTSRSLPFQEKWLTNVFCKLGLGSTLESPCTGS